MLTLGALPVPTQVTNGTGHFGISKPAADWAGSAVGLSSPVILPSEGSGCAVTSLLDGHTRELWLFREQGLSQRG